MRVWRCGWTIGAGLLLSPLFAGDSPIPAASPRNDRPPASTAFAASQKQLAAEFSLLQDQLRGATPEACEAAIHAWHQQNSARFESLQRQLKAIGEVATAPLPLVHELQIPDEATQAMEDLLVGSAELHNGLARIINQERNASPEERQQAFDAWQHRNASAFEAQQQRVHQVVAAESLPAVPPAPSEPTIPADASPALQGFLMERFALMKAHAKLQKQYRTATPEERERAFEEWHKNNAARLQRLQNCVRQLSAEP